MATAAINPQTRGSAPAERLEPESNRFEAAVSAAKQTAKSGKERVDRIRGYDGNELEAIGRAAASQMPIMREVQVIGGAMIMIGIIVIVLNEVFTMDAMDSEGPFADITDQLESTGGAAIGLLVIGLVVVAAMALMRYFQTWG